MMGNNYLIAAAERDAEKARKYAADLRAEIARLQAALTEAERRGVEMWEFAEDIVACPAAFVRASVESGEMRRERDHYKALLGFFESAGFPTPQDILEKIDRYMALAERFATSLHYKDAHELHFKDCPYRICQEARAAIDATPAEAREKEEKR